MKLQLELTPDQAEKLETRANQLGISPEDLARAVVADLLARPEDDFQAVLDATLAKNEELYRRLS